MLAAFVELGKSFKHSADGAFSLPRAYTYVAPLGVVRRVQHFIAHIEQFRQAFADRWDSDIVKRLVENQVDKLPPRLRP